MKCLRPVSQRDLDALYTLIQERGGGITNLPKNREKLREIITLSEKAFQETTTSPNQAEYFFVLEDTQTGEIGGSCAIKSETGGKDPFRLLSRLGWLQEGQ